MVAPWMKGALRAMTLGLLGVAGAFIAAVGIAHSMIAQASRDRVYDDPLTLPAREVGLVPGCSRLLDNGRLNLFFRYRIEAALAVWEADKIQSIVVSGDNRETGDRPHEMKEALVAAGVPADQVHVEGRGYNTLNSVLRLKDTHPGQNWIVISQEFQNRRAIYLGIGNGEEPVGFNARSPSLSGSFKTRLREQFSKVKAVFDVHARRDVAPAPPEAEPPARD